MTYLLTLHDWLLYAPLEEVLSILCLIGMAVSALFLSGDRRRP